MESARSGTTCKHRLLFPRNQGDLETWVAVVQIQGLNLHPSMHTQKNRTESCVYLPCLFILISLSQSKKKALPLLMASVLSR